MIYKKKFHNSDEWVEITYDEALDTMLGSWKDNDMTRDMLTIPNYIYCQDSIIDVREKPKKDGTQLVLMAGLYNMLPMDTEYDEHGNRI